MDPLVKSEPGLARPSVADPLAVMPPLEATRATAMQPTTGAPAAPAAVAAPSNRQQSADGFDFYYTQLQMLEHGRWVPITQIAIMDPGFPVPPVSRITFQPAPRELGVGRQMTHAVTQRFCTVDAFLYIDTTIPDSQQQKFAREYRRFFRFLASNDHIERLVHANATPDIEFFLKGPDIERAQTFNEQEPILCFFVPPGAPPLWQPTESVNMPLDPAFASQVQPRRIERVSPSLLDPQPQNLFPGAFAARQPLYPPHYLPPTQTSAPTFAPTIPAMAFAPATAPPRTTAAVLAVAPVQPQPPLPPPPAATAAASTAVAQAAPAAAASAAASVSVAAPAAPGNSSTVLMSHHFLRDLTHQHDWPFGAIGELVHNSKDAGAKVCKLSVTRLGPAKTPHFVCYDDGQGMTHQELRHALMFGRVTERTRSKETIGFFGFGLKHGSMRIGDDVLVLTKSKTTFSIGLLSQTYNQTQESVKAPIITRLKSNNKPDESVHSEAEAMEAESVISQFSVFDHFTIGKELATMAPTGTKIIIWKLRRAEIDPEDPPPGQKKKPVESDSSDSSSSEEEGDPGKKQRKAAHKLQLKKLAAAKAAADAQAPKKIFGDEQYELKFASFPHDIQIVIDPVENMQDRSNQLSREVPMDHSLRAYLAMLFLDHKMAIWVQGKVVEHVEWSTALTNPKTYPCPLKHFDRCRLMVGFSAVEQERGNAGLMLYWHKTLIDTYKRVGVQAGNSDSGLGVIGIFDVGDKIKPKNNKQGFPQSDKHVKKVMKWLAKMMDSYWHDVMEKDRVKLANQKQIDFLRTMNNVEWSQAVQCDRCHKWRRCTQHMMDVIDGKINDDGTPGDGKERKWQCFASDTRVLTSDGYLFEPEIAAALADKTRRDPLLFACFDNKTGAIVYGPGQLVHPANTAKKLITFVDPDNHIMMRVTPGHDMFVQVSTSGRLPVDDQIETDEEEIVESTPGGVASEESKEEAKEPERNQAGYRWQKMETDDDETETENDADHLIRAVMTLKVSSASASCAAAHPTAEDSVAMEFLPVLPSEKAGNPREPKKRTAQELFAGYRAKGIRFQAVAPAGVARDDADADEEFFSELGLQSKAQIDAFIELYGFWLGHGSLDINAKALRFPQVTVEDDAWLRELLPKTGLAANEWSAVPSGFFVRPQSWFDVFHAEYGKVWVKSTKWLFWWVLKRLSRDQCRLLLRGLCRADGSWQAKRARVFTSSVSFRDDVCAMLANAGYAAHFSAMYEQGAVRGYNLDKQMRGDQPTREAGPGPSQAIVAMPANWAIDWSDPSSSSGPTAASCYPTFDGDQMKEVAYDGPVWCVSVVHQDHLIIAQGTHSKGGVVVQASRPVIIGNCYQNPDPRFNSCEVPQDPTMEDVDEVVVGVSRGGVIEDEDAAPARTAGASDKPVKKVHVPLPSTAASAGPAKKLVATPTPKHPPAKKVDRDGDATMAAAAARPSIAVAAAAKPAAGRVAIPSRVAPPPAPVVAAAAAPSSGTKRKAVEPTSPANSISSTKAGPPSQAAGAPQTKKVKHTAEPAAAAAAAAESDESDEDQGDSDEETSDDDSTSGDDEDEPLIDARAAQNGRKK